MRIFIIAAVPLLLSSGCFKNAEESAYQGVLSTLSLQKAALFFKQYPDSAYGESIIDGFSSSCEAGPDKKECFALLLGIIPRNHNQYDKVAARFDGAK